MDADKALEIVLADVWRARGIEPSAAACEKLGELVESARRAWPALDLDAPLLARFIAERAANAGDLDVARAPDWALASECARGSRRALAVAQAKLRRAIAPSVRKLKLCEADVESALQRVATDLFVASPGRPAGITRYDGRGDLTGWLRVAAVRAGLKVIRGGDRHASVELEQLGERLPGVGGDPDVAYLKALYRPVFQRAFQEAFAALSPRDRTLLKQSLLDGLSIDVLAGLHQIHRATAARWVLAAREDLVARTRKLFQARVQASPEECESLFRLLCSQLELTLRELAADP